MDVDTPHSIVVFAAEVMDIRKHHQMLLVDIYIFVCDETCFHYMFHF